MAKVSNLIPKLMLLGATTVMALTATVLVPSEGYVPKVYVDPVNILTSCFGHTGAELKRGQKFSEGECLNQLVGDLQKHDSEMMRAVKPPIADHVHAAFLSFCYNVGISACVSSTAFTLLNQGNTKAACQQLPRWVYADGKKLTGLVTRRQKEMALCLGESIE